MESVYGWPSLSRCCFNDKVTKGIQGGVVIMKTKDFEEIVNASFNLGFQAGAWPSNRYDKEAQEKAKRKLLKLQQRYIGPGKNEH